eukprot:3365916-Rhodomonas_salina.1
MMLRRRSISSIRLTLSLTPSSQRMDAYMRMTSSIRSNKNWKPTDMTCTSTTLIQLRSAFTENGSTW